MTAPRALATRIAGSLFDHIERERSLVRSNVEEVIHDALMLDASRPRLETMPDPVRDAAGKVIRLMLNNPTLTRKMPTELDGPLFDLYQALLRTGWML